MRTRQNRLEIHLSDKEYRHLKKQAEASGLSLSAFIRKAIMGIEVKARPPTDYPEILRQLSGIGNNLNQIARKANSSDEVVMEELKEIQGSVDELWDYIKNV